MISVQFRLLLIALAITTTSMMMVYARLHGNRNIDFLFLQAISIFFPIIDLSVTVADFRITCFLVISLVYSALRLRMLVFFCKKKPIMLLIGVMLVAALFSEFKATSAVTVVFRFFTIVPCIAATYFAFFRFARKRCFKTKFLSLFIFPIIYSFLFGVIQVFNPDFSLYSSVWNKEVVLRASLCYLDPQIAGCMAGTLAIITFNRFLSGCRFEWLACTFMLLFVGCLTGSKTFLIGFPLAVIVSLMNSKSFVRSGIVILCMVFILAVTYRLWINLPVFSRMGDAQSSLEGRAGLYWLTAIEIFLDNLWTGIGPGSFFEYVESNSLPLVHMIDGTRVSASQPESGYLLWLDEYGLFSIGLFALLIFAFSRKGDALCNRSLLIPWMICFVSLYNLTSAHVSYVVDIIVGALFALSNTRMIISQKNYFREKNSLNAQSNA